MLEEKRFSVTSLQNTRKETSILLVSIAWSSVQATKKLLISSICTGKLGISSQAYFDDLMDFPRAVEFPMTFCNLMALYLIEATRMVVSPIKDESATKIRKTSHVYFTTSLFIPFVVFCCVLGFHEASSSMITDLESFLKRFA